METGERTWYHLERNEWSIHFNVSADGKLMCGDGGDPGQVAKAPDGEWIYLFRPEPIRNLGVEGRELVQAGSSPRGEAGEYVEASVHARAQRAILAGR